MKNPAQTGSGCIRFIDLRRSGEVEKGRCLPWRKKEEGGHIFFEWNKCLWSNRLINLHYWEIVSIYFHSKNWMQSMTRRRVKTGHLPNSRDPSGDWKISGPVRGHISANSWLMWPAKKRVSWQVWTTFSYIGYMYIGTTLMICRNALKDINETWYASCIYRLSD